MFTMFMGVKVDLENVEFEVINKKRMKETLIENTHNHLRLRRILACLSITGFRLLALWLINIIDNLIVTQPELQKSRWGSSLRNTFTDDWLIYGDGED
jgi:hypothetical protein